ncbi:hypothetical protein HANVADRAFT_306 [Hanseniaspora valbyensis NRRL Y-1626]|uniref:Uncharacterized protein n=1 Tax=Hanseniaspora valbyensis NRRL Y-1626 TaxID=766949 RepID=A0A1B7TIU0_9ASCO|nr:hypothetical protein HANVADRAFT_306 [Hanseniaspora valbyensis NRRL Y-1626]
MATSNNNNNNGKHSKPTTKDISDIYLQYTSLNKGVKEMLVNSNFSNEDIYKSKFIKNESKIIELKDIDCILSLYFDDEYFYLNNYLIETSVLDECFDSFNKLLSDNLIHLLKSNNNFEDTDFFTVYDWKSLINNNQLLLFLIIFNFYIDNPLTFIIDKIFKDFVFSVNNVFTIKNYDICSVLQYVLPPDIYDISKKPEILTNSEHFMDKVSEILTINHLLSGTIYVFNESINILVLLDLFFYNNKKMDYTRHSNMKLFKKIMEKIYLQFDMRSHNSYSPQHSFSELLCKSGTASLQKKLKNFPLSNLLFKIKQKKMKIDDECKFFFLNWFGKVNIKWDAKNNAARVPYAQASIEQLVSLFQLNNIVSFASSSSSASPFKNDFLKESFIGFNFDFTKNKKYETFYKIMKCPPVTETAVINLKILTKNISNLISFSDLEKQLVWTIDQEINSPLTLLKQSSNKFIFKIAYFTIHESYLKYIAGKCLKQEKFKEIYEFIDLSRFNDFNTFFYNDTDIITAFKINSNDFIKTPFSVNSSKEVKEKITTPTTIRSKKSIKNSVSLEDINEIERNLNSNFAATKKLQASPLQQKMKSKQIPVSPDMDSQFASLLSTSNNKNKVTKFRPYESSTNMINFQLSTSFELDQQPSQLILDSFDNDLKQYLKTTGLELA